MNEKLVFVDRKEKGDGSPNLSPIDGNQFIEKDGLYSLFTSIALTSTERLLMTITKIKPKPNESYDQAFRRKLKRIEDITKCQSGQKPNTFMLIEQYDKTLKRIWVGCNSKACQECQNRRAILSRFKILEITSKYKTPVLATFSPQNLSDTEFSRQSIQKTDKEFARTREYIKRGINIKTKRKFRFDDYVAIREIKCNNVGDPKYRSYRKHGRWKKKIVGYHTKKTWNVHYHMIYDGDYIPVAWARSCYKKATHGRSHHVNFNYVHGFDDVAYYVSKYVSKIPFYGNNADAQRYYRETKGLRFIKIYGIRPTKKGIPYFKFLRTIMAQGLRYHDALIEMQKYINIMDAYDLAQYDLDLSIEANFIKYGSTERVLLASGV